MPDTLLDDFTAMVRNGDSAALPGWLEEAATSEMASFARGFTVDLDAVLAALRESWSDGLDFRLVLGRC